LNKLEQSCHPEQKPKCHLDKDVYSMLMTFASCMVSSSTMGEPNPPDQIITDYCLTLSFLFEWSRYFVIAV